MGDDIRSANFSVTEKQTETILHGLQQDVIYKLRVMGYSRGGDGKKSPTVYFTVLKGMGVCKSYTEFGGKFYPRLSAKLFVCLYTLKVKVELYSRTPLKNDISNNSNKK